MQTATYVERMLEPLTRCFTPEVAERIIHIQIDPELQQRVDELADKCTEGELTDQEKKEYETYVRIGYLIAILQAKARKYSKSQAPGDEAGAKWFDHFAFQGARIVGQISVGRATVQVLNLNDFDRLELRRELLDLGLLD